MPFDQRLYLFAWCQRKFSEYREMISATLSWPKWGEIGIVNSPKMMTTELDFGHISARVAFDCFMLYWGLKYIKNATWQVYTPYWYLTLILTSASFKPHQKKAVYLAFLQPIHPFRTDKIEMNTKTVNWINSGGLRLLSILWAQHEGGISGDGEEEPRHWNSHKSSQRQ